jgi:TonB-linked SusC/RagA family outer membrane protein
MKYLLTVEKKLHLKLLLAMKVSVVFIMFFATQAWTYSFGQQATVTGKVTGEADKLLSGVSVQVKGTTKGTTTNAQGVYSISVSNNDVLVFSYVGYEPQEIAAANKTEINVSLVAGKTNLEQVVVIGYGTANKRDLTGSIVKVQGKEIADKPNSNPISSLQSKVPGLYVVNNATPGSQPDIRIRGTVSLGQVHPLYVVDGIFNDNIDFLNPNDIESMEILKDPSSLAIFGVRGATGVIAITTKHAKAGKTTVSLNLSYGFKDLVDKIDMADSATFTKLFNQENDNNNIPLNERPDYSAFNANTNWIDAVVRTGIFTNNSLSVSSASQTNKVFFGMGYLKDEGIIKHEQLERINVSLNDELNITKNIKLGASIDISRQHNPYDATWVLDDARKVQPHVQAGTKPFVVLNPYGSDSITENLYSALAIQGSGVENPLLRLENTWDKTISYTYRWVGSVYADITFLKYLNFRSTFYGDLSNLNSRIYTPLYYTYTPVTNTTYLYSTQTSVVENDKDIKKWQQDYILTFKKSFGQHNLTATGGFTTYYFGSFQRQVNVKQSTTGLPIPDDKRFWYMNSGFGVVDPTINANGGTYSSQGEATTVSYLARALYNYAGKYYLNASFRDDGSSQIPPQNRHQQFWALGGAWEVSKENFMANQKIFNYLKIKGSVGMLGNQTTNQENVTPADFNYPFYPTLVTGAVAVFGTNAFTAARNAYKVNPDLKWETVDAWEAGVELNAFDNRLHFEGTYYNKTTNDLMTYVDRSTIGLDNELINGGKLRNWGEEFSASWTQNFSQGLRITVSGNITFLKNKVISLAEDLKETGGYLSRVYENNGSAEARSIPGYPVGSFYGYVVEGLYQSDEDIQKSPDASSIGSYRPGDFKFKDVNGDSVITSDDRTIIGNPSPKFIYGGTIEASYKGFSLSVDVGGVDGNDVFRTWASLESPFQRVNYAAFQTSAWHGEGTSNWVPIISQADRFNYNGSTYNIENGSYFRIRNLQLAYNFPNKSITRLHIQNLRLYANVQNLKTWKHNKGYSPEFTGDATAFGFDFAGGALPVVTTFGLNVTF